MDSLLPALTGTLFLMIMVFSLVLCKGKKIKGSEDDDQMRTSVSDPGTPNPNKIEHKVVFGPENKNKMSRSDKKKLSKKKKKDKKQASKKNGGPSTYKVQRTQAVSAIPMTNRRKEDEWDEQQATNKDAGSLPINSAPASNDSFADCPSLSFKMGTPKAKMMMVGK